MDLANNNYFIKNLVTLIGYEIIRVLKTPNIDGNTYLGLALRKGADIRNIWFLRDGEGNGPGFVQIYPPFEDNELREF